MLKYILAGATCVVIRVGHASAQTLEDKVVAASCECLQRSKEKSEAAVKQCFSASLVQVMTQDSSRRYLRQLSTVEQVKGLTRNVYARLAHECSTPASPRRKE